MVITADPKLNNYLFQQEGKEVELWYLDTFQKVFRLEGDEARPNAVGHIHKYVSGSFLTLFGVDSLRTKLLSEIETTVRTNIHRWSTQGTIDAKKEAANDQAHSHINSEAIGMLDKDKLEKLIRAMLKERIACPEEKKGDFLDHAVKDLNTDFFLTENFILSITVGALFATVESISTAMTLSFKLFAEHPWVVEDLVAEHDILLKNRENKESLLTWDEYKSITVTMHVINEVLRLGNVSPGILRRTLKDINYNGYTILAGWAIMIVTCTLQLNPNVFKDPLAFNLRRWKPTLLGAWQPGNSFSAMAMLCSLPERSARPTERGPSSVVFRHSRTWNKSCRLAVGLPAELSREPWSLVSWRTSRPNPHLTEFLHRSQVAWSNHALP
ncbi:hypothetical protein ACSBR1_027049 [Camellia fascicularis]